MTNTCVVCKVHNKLAVDFGYQTAPQFYTRIKWSNWKYKILLKDEHRVSWQGFVRSKDLYDQHLCGLWFPLSGYHCAQTLVFPGYLHCVSITFHLARPFISWGKEPPPVIPLSASLLGWMDWVIMVNRLVVSFPIRISLLQCYFQRS